MRIVRIDPYESLAASEVAWLREIVAMADPYPGGARWLEKRLVVYVTDEPERGDAEHRVVAPCAEDVGEGDGVRLLGWTGTQASSNDAAGIHAAGGIMRAPRVNRRS